MQRVRATTFPWLMSNVIDNETRRPLVLIVTFLKIVFDRQIFFFIIQADGKCSLVIDWHGMRIGLVTK